MILNIFYCLKQVSKYNIWLQEIRSMTTIIDHSVPRIEIMVICNCTVQSLLEVDGGMMLVPLPISTVNITKAKKKIITQLFTGTGGGIILTL